MTTIPAAADIGVSLAFQNWSEARGSLIQLLLNVAILIAVGAVGLTVQQTDVEADRETDDDPPL